MGALSKVLAGAVLGAVGTLYATNEDFRKRLPGVVRELPDAARERFRSAVNAGREAAVKRQQEISQELKQHGGSLDRSSRKRFQAGESNIYPQDATQRMQRVKDDSD